jgi:flagellar assembly protein FliH
VLGDPDQAIGDARLEWVDGGIARDRALLEAEIDRRVASYIAAQGGSSQAPVEGPEQ